MQTHTPLATVRNGRLASQWLATLAPLLHTALALALTIAAFSLFVAFVGQNPVEVWRLLYQGAFSNAFSWQNTLLRAAPLILTAMAVVLPAQAGLVIIGGEGALVIGALSAAAFGYLVNGLPGMIGLIAMLVAGALAGGAWIALCGWLRSERSVNETISSLLLSYIAVAVFNHLVEGPLRDPASLNKPSTPPISSAYAMGTLPGSDVHWGLVIGIAVAVVAYLFSRSTTGGFAARIVGGNPRAARMVGISVKKWLIGMCAAGGAAAGLAGAIEISAVHGSANAGVIAGYGNAGILIAFIARQNPLAVIPVAIVIGGINAASGLLQRRLDMPDATVLVLQGIAFVSILALEAVRGKTFLPKVAP